MVKLNLISVTTEYDVENKTIFVRQFYTTDDGILYSRTEYVPLGDEQCDKLSFEIPQKVLENEFVKEINRPL